MKCFFLTLLVFPVYLSCTNQSNTVSKIPDKDTVVIQSFFPVTSFLKGQLYDIKKSGINPLKYTTIKNHTDSVWLKLEQIDEAVNEFLHPEIDSVNLISMFTEKSFLDQSIDAFTFTYDPVGPLPDTMNLKHWDVYIDPTNGKVKRIYIVKEINKTKMLQLTWLSNQWCKITSIITDQDGTSTIEKEEKITWDFNN